MTDNVKRQDEAMVDLLRHIDAGVCDVPTVAESLDLTQEEVKARLETLKIMGFLEAGEGAHEYDAGSQGCMGCGMSRVCAEDGAPPGNDQDYSTWRISGKGRYLLDKWQEAGK